MANLIEQVPNPTSLATKTLVLAHRTELLEQASNQIMRFHPSWVKSYIQNAHNVNTDCLYLASGDRTR